MMLLTGDRDGAKARFRQALELTRGSDDAFCTAVSRGSLVLMDLQDGTGTDAFSELRKNVEQVTGHFAEVTARKLLGQALLEHGGADHERSEGRRTLLQALNIARKHENVVEITRIQEVLERNE